MSGMEDYSPFQAGIGAHATMVQVPLGTGFMQVWKHGEARIYEDPLGDPIVTFTPEDGPMLRALADELEAAAEEYAEYMRDKNDDSGESEPEKVLPETQSNLGQGPTKKPVIVAGAGASDSLNNYCLK